MANIIFHNARVHNEHRLTGGVGPFVEAKHYAYKYSIRYAEMHEPMNPVEFLDFLDENLRGTIVVCDDNRIMFNHEDNAMTLAMKFDQVNKYNEPILHIMFKNEYHEFQWRKEWDD